MNPENMLERLVSAEIAFAHFNALRTAVAEDVQGIRRGANAHFEYLVDPTRPASTYYNRAVARCADALDDASLRTLPADVAGIEISPSQLTAVAADRLIAMGFRPAYQLCYLAVAPAGALPVKREVVRLERSQTDFFLDLLQLEGVDFPPEKRLRKRNYYCTDRFQAYVARTGDGAACAWSTMYVNDGTAFFGNSFTLPQYRGAGAHRALLAARLNAAAELGLDVAYTDVAHGSQSHANCEWAGFRTLTVNTIWARRA